MYADSRSKGGWLAVGMVEQDGIWVTSEGLFKDKEHAISNLNYCFCVLRNSVFTVKIKLPKV